jgi:transcriptional regulator with XRE-family HTH domain
LKTFGQRIRAERKRLNMKQIDLVFAARIAQGRLSQLEHDKAEPSLAETKALAAAFGIGIDELVGEAKGVKRA